MKKIHILILITCLSCFLFSGCQKERAIEKMPDATPIVEMPDATPEVAENSVYGDWIDEKNQVFFALNEDNSYFIGGEKYNETAGGTATVNDKVITLKPKYVIVDTVQQPVPESGSTEMVWNYSFTSNKHLVIKTDDYSFEFKRNDRQTNERNDGPAND